MTKTCNLELRLVTPSALLHSLDHNGDYYPTLNMLNENPNENQRQQLTIFYNGNVTVCNVTEFKAREMMTLLARRETAERIDPIGSDPCSPLTRSPILHSPTALSQRRSLQRFLNQRKSTKSTRLQSGPYRR